MFQSLLIPATGEPDQIATNAELSRSPPRLRAMAMTVRELRARALHYRRVADLVTDDALAQAFSELAAEDASLADKMEGERTPRAAEQ